MYAFGDAFEESKRKLVWKNVDGNLSGYEQFKLDKLSSYRNGSSGQNEFQRCIIGGTVRL